MSADDTDGKSRQGHSSWNNVDIIKSLVKTSKGPVWDRRDRGGHFEKGAGGWQWAGGWAGDVFFINTISEPQSNARVCAN